MADESMVRNLRAQIECIWPQERLVFERHGVPRAPRVLDVGCGTGELVACLGERVYLLRGGYEVDGREIAPLDETRVREAARELRRAGVEAVAITSAFAPMNAAMEERARGLTERLDTAENHLGTIIPRLDEVGRARDESGASRFHAERGRRFAPGATRRRRDVHFDRGWKSQSQCLPSG